MAVVSLSSCGEYNKLMKCTDYEYKYEAAKTYFADGKYTKASTLLMELITILKGSGNAEEALYMLGGETVRRRVLSLLLSAAPLFESGITGQLPEVLDGDAPHIPGGCAAQAWSVSEFFRVLDILEKK